VKGEVGARARCRGEMEEATVCKYIYKLGGTIIRGGWLSFPKVNIELIKEPTN